MNEIKELIGEFPLLEKIVAGLVLFILSVVQAFFWKSKEDQNKRIDKNEKATLDAHTRITNQASDNNDRFARRDDVKDIEQRLVNTMQSGFNDLKEDIRAIGKD